MQVWPSMLTCLCRDEFLQIPYCIVLITFHSDLLPQAIIADHFDHIVSDIYVLWLSIYLDDTRRILTEESYYL